MQWSQLKKQVEARFAPSLRGRVQVWSTLYRKPATSDGRAWITIDGEQVWSMSDQPGDRAWKALHAAVEEAERSDPDDVEGALRRQSAYLFTRREFRTTLECFLGSTVEELLELPLPLTRALAMLDRRLGKRRFLRLAGIEREHPIVQLLYRVRAEAEGWPATQAAVRAPAMPEGGT